MRRKLGVGNLIFDICNIVVLGIIALVTVLPFIHVIVSSFTPPGELMKSDFIIIPKSISLDAYKYIFSTNVVARGLAVSILVTLVGTVFNMIMTVLMAYPLAHKGLLARKAIMLMVTFTLMFNGGMVPSYIIIQKLHLLNNYWALILPGAISAFSLIIFKNYFQELPAELEESAKLDGANDLLILFRIILPVSKPLIATFLVMFGVGYWNSWFNAVLYLNDAKMWPIQVVLRQVISATSNIGDMMETNIVIPPKTVQMCTITIATLPILCVYPFLQKYFTQGILLGSVKG